MKTIELIKSDKGFELNEEVNWVLKREHGYSPVQALVAAAGACGGYVYSSVLERSQIPFEFESVQLYYTVREESKAKGLASLEIVFRLSVAEEKQAQAIRALRLVAEYCPVIQSLNPSIKVIERAEFI